MSESAIRVTAGNPTPEELAALVVVLHATAGPAAGGVGATPVRNAWADPSRRMPSRPGGDRPAKPTWLRSRPRWERP